VVQILRQRRKGLDHLRRPHPGAVEVMPGGVPFVHPGIGDREASDRLLTKSLPT